MYLNDSKPKFYAIILIVIGAFMIVFELLHSFSFSIVGLVTLIMGIGLLTVISTMAEEIRSLRSELFDVRKIAENSSDSSRGPRSYD